MKFAISGRLGELFNKKDDESKGEATAIPRGESLHPKDAKPRSCSKGAESPGSRGAAGPRRSSSQSTGMRSAEEQRGAKPRQAAVSLREIAVSRAAPARGSEPPPVTRRSGGSRGKKPAEPARTGIPKTAAASQASPANGVKAPQEAFLRSLVTAPPAGVSEERSGGTRNKLTPGEYIREEYIRLDQEEKLSRAITCMLSMDSRIRPHNSAKKSGGLVEFPQDDEREMIVVGDIHANKKNLKAVLMDSGNLNKVRKDEAVIILLGDIVHDERTGYLFEMDSSIEILDIVIHLINRYPANIVYLRGNHDTLSPRLSKSGIQQGVIFRQALVEARGTRYADLAWDFFGALPVFVKHRCFLAMHGGPVRGGIGRPELINVAHYQDCEHQLIWNRINETYSTPSKKEYAPDDLDETRKALKCPPDIPIVVGHNPMWKWGGNDSVWTDVLKTHDHVILYSGARAVCPYLVFRDSSEYEIRYANLKLKQKRFVLDND